MREQPRFVTLDGLRGVAAIAVMLLHVAPGVGAAWMPGAGVAVDIFFCLSGFVLARAMDHSPPQEFARRRWARLYPLYAMGLFAGFIVHVCALAAGAPVSGPATALAALGAGALFMPVLFPVTSGFGNSFTVGWPYPFNPPSWSLFYELAVNALFARFRPKGGRLAAWIALFAVSVAAMAAFSPHVGGVGVFATGAPRALFEFYAGYGLRCLSDAGRLPRWRWQGLAPFAAAMVAMQAIPYGSGRYLVSVLVIAPALVALCAAEPTTPALGRLYALAGRISYPLYALHWPLFKLARLACDRALDLPLEAPMPPAVFVLYLAALAALSLLIADRIEPKLRATLLRLSAPKISPVDGLAAERA